MQLFLYLYSKIIDMLKKVASLFTKPLSTVADEMTSKFKTPFFTTFIVVWIFKNNMFVYNLFFNSHIPDKTFILQDQLTFDKYFFGDSLLTILYSLLALAFFYFILNISRAITMYSEERLKLNLLKKLKSDTITTIEDENYWKLKEKAMREQNKTLQEEINTLRSSKDYAESRLNDKIKDYDKLKNQTDATIEQIKKVVEQNLVNNVLNTTDFNSRTVNTKKGIELAIKPYTNINKVPTFLAG